MNKKWPLRLPAVLFFLSMAAALWAQNDTEIRYIRLTWSGDAYALRYEVIIEKAESGTYRKVFQEFTNTPFIGVTLPLGNYRCRVIPYDYLEHPGQGSQWISFVVRTAYVPPPPEPVEKAEITIAYPEPEPEAEPEQVDPDEYSETPPPVEDRKLFNFYVSAGWMPLLPLYHEDEERFFNPSPSFLGASVRAGLLYPALGFIIPGLEFSGSWYAFDAPGGDKQHALTFGLNLVAQKRTGRMALAFRFGIGLAFLPGSGDEVSLGESFFTNVGVSFLFFATKQLYLEAGFEHMNIFTGVNSGCFRPWLGAGWKF